MIEYIPEKYIVVDALSRLADNGYQKTTHESAFTTESMSGLYGIDEMSGGTFPISLNIIDHYQREYPILFKKMILNNIKGVLFL